MDCMSGALQTAPLTAVATTMLLYFMYIAMLQVLQVHPGKSVNLILEEAMQTNSRAPDTQAAIASRVQNKVLMLDNPTANLLTKARGTGNHKKVASHLLPGSKRPKIASSPCRYSCNYVIRARDEVLPGCKRMLCM